MRASPSNILQPRGGFFPRSRRPERLLLLSHYDPKGISTVPETIACLQEFSEFSLTSVNLYEHRRGYGKLALHPSFNLDAFDGVVIHNTIAYNVDNIRALDIHTVRKLKDFHGAKILMKQDENVRFHALAEYIDETGFDGIFSCLPPESIELVYPAKLVGKPKFRRMLTGYVTPTLRALDPTRADRPIDIGYRGSMQPLSFGRLAYEKRKIGDDVAYRLAKRGLELNISSRWKDRFGGNEWLNFIGSCKATLGAESGASLFDLDGDLDKRIAVIEERLGPERDDDAYAEAYLTELANLEGRINYNQISPRHFEAAAAGTLQLLYPGEYSHIFKAGRHYFPLKRDYSNLEEAVDLLRDEPRRQRVTECAYEEIVLNEGNWIESFAQQFDALVEEILDDKNLLHHPFAEVGPGQHALVLTAQEPDDYPRIGWIVDSAPEPVVVHQLGLVNPGKPITLRPGPRHAVQQTTQRMPWQPRMVTGLKLCAVESAEAATFKELLELEKLADLCLTDFAAYFGLAEDHPRLADFQWSVRQILANTGSLVTAAEGWRGLSAIIVSGLDALLAGIILKAYLRLPVMYDAHPTWLTTDERAPVCEKNFWVTLEARLMAHVDYSYRTASTDRLECHQISEAMYGALEKLVNAHPQPLTCFAASPLLSPYLAIQPPEPGTEINAPPLVAPQRLRHLHAVWRRLPPSAQESLRPLVQYMKRHALS